MNNALDRTSESWPSHRPMVDDDLVDQVAEELRLLCRGATMELTLRIGELVTGRFYGGDITVFRTRGTKEQSLRKLAARDDLPFSATALYRSMAIYELVERLGGVSTWKHLGPSHFRCVLGLREEKQRELLEAAEVARWTVRALEHEASQAKEPASRKGGRPRLPRFVKTIRQLRKFVDQADTRFADRSVLGRMELPLVEELYETMVELEKICQQITRQLLERLSTA